MDKSRQALLSRTASTTPLSDPAAAAPGGDALIGPAAGRNLHIMSFNVRCVVAGTAPGHPDHWPDRAPLVQEFLGLEQPTLLGVQEAGFEQLAAIRSGLPACYRMIGFGREGRSVGEYSAVFYDSRRLEVLEWQQWWLSSTPDVVASRTWGNTVPRIATWGRFADRATGMQFVAANTHFDHESEPSRIKSAELLATLADRFEGLPSVVMGDFNDLAGASASYARLVDDGPFTDAWEAAGQRLTPDWGTFTDYAPPVEGAKVIDWILTSPDVSVHRAAVNTWNDAGRWPSDHAAVQALVTL